MVDRVTNSAVEYQVQSDDTGALITGHEVFRFGVPMIGEYDERLARTTIKPVVPGAQYRITAWALTAHAGRRSAIPAVKYATTEEASEHSCILPILAGKPAEGLPCSGAPAMESCCQPHDASVSHDIQCVHASL